MSPGSLFSLISILFVSFLLIVILYESFITQALPSDNMERLQNMSSKYGPDFNIDLDVIQEAHGQLYTLYAYNQSFGDNQTIEIFYDQPRELLYKKYDIGEDEEEESEREKYDRGFVDEAKYFDKDEDDQDNKYSIQICPPKCGNNDNEKDKDDEDHEEDEKDNDDQDDEEENEET